MQIKRLYLLIGAAMLALGLTIVPATAGAGWAQDTTPDPVITDPTDPTRDVREFETPPDQLGRETAQEVEAAEEAAEQNLQEAGQNTVEAAQDAAQATQAATQEAANNAQQAAEQAQLAAENAAETLDEQANWGWLGLLGLIGLFGLAGRNKRRVYEDEAYRQSTPTNPADYHTSDYR